LGAVSCADGGAPLWAKALAIEDRNRNRVVIVATDRIGLPQEIAREMFFRRRRLHDVREKRRSRKCRGILCTNDDVLAQQEKDLVILTEGLATIAFGLGEALEQEYLKTASPPLHFF
jgi:hypothetical protein